MRILDFHKDVRLEDITSSEQQVLTRTIMLCGEIDECLVTSIKEQVELLSYIDNKATITIEVDSYGGDVYSGLALYDKIRTCQTPINTVVVGKAMSAAFWIVLGGKERAIAPNGTMMIHELKTGLSDTKLADLKVEQKECERLDRMAYSIVKERSSVPPRIISRSKKQDVYFNAQECLKWGIVHNILTYS